MTREPFYDALRLSEADRKELMTLLEGQSAAGAEVNRRKDERLSYQVRGLIVQMHHPGGSVVNYLVRPRNLSRRGIAFLHGSFCYSGTPVQVALRSPDGSSDILPGKVVRCQHLRGVIHDVGVRFDEAIDVRAFTASTADGSGPASSAALPRFAGRVLHLEATPDDRDLLRFQLGQVGLVVDPAEDAEQALALVGNASYDLVIAGMWLTNGDGCGALRALREAGYDGPAIMLTSDHAGEVREQALGTGFVQVLTRPYDLVTLVGHLRGLLPAAPDPAAGPLLSEHWEDRAMRPLITQFLDRLEGQVTELDAMIGDADARADARKSISALRGSAGSFGYPQLSQAAERLHQQICRDEADLREVRKAFAELTALCRAACAALGD